MSKSVEEYHKEFDALYGGHEPNLSLSKVELAASEAAYGWQSDKEGRLTLEMFPEVFKRGFLNGYELAEKDLGWISVKDRLPEENKWVFVCVDMQGVPQCVGLGYLKDEWWCDDENDDGFCVDYWMEIPKLPKEEKQ